MLAGHDLTSNYMVPFSYLQNYHYKAIECVLCVSVKYCSWGAPAHLVLQPIDLRLALV